MGHPCSTSLQRGDSRVVKASGLGGLEWDSVFWTWQDHCIHILTAAAVACTRSSQPTSRQGTDSGSQTSTPRWELLTVAGPGEGDSVLQWIVSYPCVYELNKVNAMGSLKKNVIELEVASGRWSMDPGGLKGKNWYDQNILYICIKFSKK